MSEVAIGEGGFDNTVEHIVLHSGDAQEWIFDAGEA